MIVVIGEELKKICCNILREQKTESEWAAIEADDFFESSQYVGGFDSTEMAFCFSYFDDNKKEYWFQFSLADVEKIVNGQITKIAIRARQE